MAKPGLSNIATTQTFQTWLDTTNDIIDIMKTDAMTASALGDTASGNSTLLGNFTANTITAFDLLRVDSVSPKPGTLSIGFNSPINISSSSQTAATLISANGPRVNYSSGPVIWRTGFEDTANSNFTIDTGVGTRKLLLTPAGNLTVAGTMTAPGGITGNLTGNVTGNVTGTVSSLSNHTTDGLTEGSSNLYFTTARARNSISAGTGITYDPVTGVISAVVNAGSVRGYLSAGTGVTYNNTTGVISIGQAVGTSSNVTFNNINAGGNIVAVGDVTAFSSTSDIRKKENIVKIENALEKVLQISGYTYNFKGDDTKLAGVIAQELEAVLPEVIYEIEDEELGRSKAVRYGNIVGLLIEAIKDLKKEVEDLKNGN
jgi:hypothetical protein